MAVCILLGGCGTKENAEGEDSSAVQQEGQGIGHGVQSGQKKATWQDAYADVLADCLESADGVQEHYAVCDVTQDGIPELFLQTKGIRAVYTLSGNEILLLGEVPGLPYRICPLAEEAGFLAVMQHQYTETVIAYRLEEGGFAEERVLTEAPVGRLLQNGGLPQSAAGYRDYGELKTYALNDPAGLTQPQVPESRNGEILTYLLAHKEELEGTNVLQIHAGSYSNQAMGIRCAYPASFESSPVSDDPWVLYKCENVEKEQEMEIYCRELDQPMTAEQALELCRQEYPDMEETYSASGKNWYVISLKTSGCYLYRKAFLRESGSVLIWFDYCIWQDTIKKSASDNITYIEENFSVAE